MTRNNTAAALLEPTLARLGPTRAESLDELLGPIDQLMGEGRFDLCYPLLKHLRALLGSDEKLSRRLARLYRAWVPRWHFGMLNDRARNRAFADAIAAASIAGKTILDIGAGSGLLSMMAAKRGAAHVYACEMVMPVAEKAAEIVAANGYTDQITIIPKLSHDLRVGVDMPSRAEVLISETIDCGFVGEGFLRALQHARAHLLRPDAVLIPRSFVLEGALLQSDDVYQLNRAGSAHGFRVDGFNEFATQGYFPVRLDTWSHRLLTNIESLVELDLRTYDFAPVERCVEFEARTAGRVHGVVFWFDVELFPGIQMSNAPDGETAHWMQAFACFDTPLAVAQGDRIPIDLRFALDSARLTLRSRR